MTPEPWMEHAACAGWDPEYWFPTENQSWAGRMLAVAICHDCDVRAECLGYAYRIDARHGIWGGLHMGNRPRPP